MKLMDAARQRGAFKRPDISQFVPKGMEDAVARISAAGQRLMYAPDMREELAAAVESKSPIPQKMAESVVGLMLVLDQQAKGGMPEEAIFPAALDLLAEAAEVLEKAGQTVTQEDYNEAARTVFVLVAKKLGIDDQQAMGAVEQAAGAPENEPGEGPEHETAEGPQRERIEDAGNDEEDMP